MTEQPDPHGNSTVQRRRWMAVLARAAADDLASAMETCPAPPPWRALRGPESGLVMVRGRAGGGGAPFNLGEMTVTRCTIRTEEGWIGHATIAGRDGRKATLAALADALLQEPARAPALLEHVIAPLARAQEAARETTARKAAATKVQFFTLASMRT